VNQIEDYEKIADVYEASMRLPFRDAVEQYTLMGILGDVTGVKAVDMACGDGFYARLLKRAGASDVLGIDASAEMVRRAEEEERRNPLGCTYRQADVAGSARRVTTPCAPADGSSASTTTSGTPAAESGRSTVWRGRAQAHRPRATKSGTPSPTPTAEGSSS
jgi:hypothetical protein